MRPAQASKVPAGMPPGMPPASDDRRATSCEYAAQVGPASSRGGPPDAPPSPPTSPPAELQIETKTSAAALEESKSTLEGKPIARRRKLGSIAFSLWLVMSPREA